MDPETVETKTDDDFSAAFASFSEPEPKTDPAPEVATNDTAVDAPADADPVADPVAADPAPAADSEPAPAETEPSAAAPAAPAAAAPTEDADAILQRLSDLVREKPAAPAPAPAAAAPAEPEIYNDEEKKFLETYDTDWSDVAKGESLKRKAEYRSLLNYVFQEVAKEFAPIRDLAQELAERTALSDIRQAVPDYSDNLRDQVVAWAANQPAYLKVAYDHVIKSGTVQEVNDLISRYKAETGVATPAPAAAPAKAAELPAATKAAAASLAPVSTKRSVVEQKDDPSNFDAAFAKFADSI